MSIQMTKTEAERRFVNQARLSGNEVIFWRGKQPYSRSKEWLFGRKETFEAPITFYINDDPVEIVDDAGL